MTDSLHQSADKVQRWQYESSILSCALMMVNAQADAQLGCEDFS
jgi:hypothetical protein